MITLPGGVFLMGTDEPIYPADGEGPVRQISLRPFRISPGAVTNREFAQFVDATGYVTDAERYGWSFVFYQFVSADAGVGPGYASGAPWWRAVRGAYWRTPEGPRSSVADHQDHPVVHVSWNDASAYCQWAGGRLPTEAEWEYAARGGLHQMPYPWGRELTPGGQHRCNVWQGTFPTDNTCEDGYFATAPVRAYEPNGYGLLNMCGNVWEWCSDWFSATPHRVASPIDPKGPLVGETKVLRGGSYLCHASYCHRYRVSARTPNTPDGSTGHTGFRCAGSLSGGSSLCPREQSRAATSPGNVGEPRLRHGERQA